MRMGKAPQNAAFPFEPFAAAFPHERDVENLHCRTPFKSPIISFRQPHGAHASAADLRNQSVDTKDLAGQAGVGRQLNGTLVEKSLFGQYAVLLEKQFQLTCQGRIFRTKSREPRRTLLVCQFENLIEPWAQGLPLLWTKFGHPRLRVADPREYCGAERCG